MNKDTWLKLMAQLGFARNEEEFQVIVEAYNDSNRYYHNGNHIEDCLEKCKLIPDSNALVPIKLAIWYHDVI